MSGRSIEKLLRVDVARLSFDDALDHLAELDALAARVAARRERVLAVVHDPDDAKEFVRDEVACVLRWSSGYAKARLVQAAHVVAHLPRLLDLQERGQIGEAHLGAAAEATYGLDPTAIVEVQARVVARASEQTPASFKASLRRAIAAVDARNVEQRHQEAMKTAAVSVCPLADGMAALWYVHDAATVEAVFARLTDLAKAAGGDRRGIDERRADALARRVLGSDGDGSVATRPVIQLRTPSATLARHLRVAWPTCRFPGCNRRALRAELDHIVAWNGRNTVKRNMQPLCPRHHHLKTEAGWDVRRDDDGVTVWISPTGHVHRKRPDQLPTGDP